MRGSVELYLTSAMWGFGSSRSGLSTLSGQLSKILMRCKNYSGSLCNVIILTGEVLYCIRLSKAKCQAGRNRLNVVFTQW